MTRCHARADAWPCSFTDRCRSIAVEAGFAADRPRPVRPSPPRRQGCGYGLVKAILSLVGPAEPAGGWRLRYKRRSGVLRGLLSRRREPTRSAQIRSTLVFPVAEPGPRGSLPAHIRQNENAGLNRIGTRTGPSVPQAPRVVRKPPCPAGPDRPDPSKQDGWPPNAPCTEPAAFQTRPAPDIGSYGKFRRLYYKILHISQNTAISMRCPPFLSSDI
jgi:hypothetical protein